MFQRDSNSFTLLVAVVLCLVCSCVVSVAAVALRPRQEANKKLDQQKNILDAAGLSLGEYGRPAAELSSEQIDELYSWVNERLIDLKEGTYNDEANADDWDLVETLGKADLRNDIESPEYDLGEQYSPKTMKVYLVSRPGSDKIQQVVLPIYGKGLWGTLYGYLALKSDLKTIQGITFYEHKETPGLGGEVDNPGWKQQWEDLKLYDDEGTPAALVFKGPAPMGDPHAVDGLSGATITSRGVTNLVRFWASDDGYGPFLNTLKQKMDSGNTKPAAAAHSPNPSLQQASDNLVAKG